MCVLRVGFMFFPSIKPTNTLSVFGQKMMPLHLCFNFFFLCWFRRPGDEEVVLIATIQQDGECCSLSVAKSAGVFFFFSLSGTELTWRRAAEQRTLND